MKTPMSHKEWNDFFSREKPKDITKEVATARWKQSYSSTFIPMTCVSHGFFEHKNKRYEMMAHSHPRGSRWVDIKQLAGLYGSAT